MPFKSDAQRRWAHTKAGTSALGGAGKVAEWDQASKGANLPGRSPQQDGKRLAKANRLLKNRGL